MPHFCSLLSSLFLLSCASCFTLTVCVGCRFLFCFLHVSSSLISYSCVPFLFPVSSCVYSPLLPVRSSVHRPLCISTCISKFQAFLCICQFPVCLWVFFWGVFFPPTITACFLLNIHLHSMCLHLGPPSNPATVCQLRQ